MAITPSVAKRKLETLEEILAPQRVANDLEEYQKDYKEVVDILKKSDKHRLVSFFMLHMELLDNSLEELQDMRQYLAEISTEGYSVKYKSEKEIERDLSPGFKDGNSRFGEPYGWFA